MRAFPITGSTFSAPGQGLVRPHLRPETAHSPPIEAATMDRINRYEIYYTIVHNDYVRVVDRGQGFRLSSFAELEEKFRSS